MADGSIDKLRDARDKSAEVYEAEVQDEVFDNGLLDTLNSAIKSLELAIKLLEKRSS